MSLIFPKKEILYAPMLGSLGGGSARGFGRGIGGGVVYEFTTQNTAGYFGPSSLSYATNHAALGGGYNQSQYMDLAAGTSYEFTIKGASALPQYYNGVLWPHWGKGASFTGVLNVVQNIRIWVKVGQLPANPYGVTDWDGNVNNLSSVDNCFVGGGGGTFVAYTHSGNGWNTASPIIVAGGGGSVRNEFSYNTNEVNAKQDFNTNGYNGAYGAQGGSGGNGGSHATGGQSGTGSSSDSGTPGAGFYGNAENNTNAVYVAQAKAYVYGGYGARVSSSYNGSPPAHGGFGGGGAGGWGGSGGGGGYNGGGAGSNNSAEAHGGGGSNYRDINFSYGNLSNLSSITLTDGAGYFSLQEV